MIVEYSIALIALAFLALAIYLIKTLVALRKFILQTSSKTDLLEKELQLFSVEGHEFMRLNNEIAGNIYNKLSALDPSFQLIEEVTRHIYHKGKEVQLDKKDKKIQCLALELFELLGECATLIKTCKRESRHG